LYNIRKDEWLQAVEQQGIAFMPVTINDLQFHQSALGRQVRACNSEHDRLKIQFCSEVCRVLSQCVVRVVAGGRSQKADSSPASCLDDIIEIYADLTEELLAREKLELECAANFDALHAASAVSAMASNSSQLPEAKACFSTFKYSEMFASSICFENSIRSLLS
jgi:hypothetical protein